MILGRMHPREKGIALNGAPSQYDRLLKVPDDTDVKVDGRTFAELLSFAVPYGRLLKFYNVSNEPEGDWALFFLTDPTMVLATVAAIDLGSIEQRFFSMLSSVKEPGSPGKKSARLEKLFRFILDIARQMDTWLNASRMHPGSRRARLFAGEITSWIGDLRPHLRQFKMQAELGALAGLIAPLDLDAFLPLWNPSTDGPAQLPRGDCAPSDLIEDAVSHIDEVFRAFIEVLRELQKFARKHLPATLLEAGHKPHIALYIAFVRLFGTAQKTINNIPKRFTQFYYRDVLRGRNAAAIPDSVYLTFALDPKAGMPVANIPMGAQFPAGKEADGTTILYACDKSTSISAATLAVVRTVRIVEGPLYSVVSSPPEINAAVGRAANLLIASEINVPLMNSEAAGKVPAGGLAPWATFGQSTSTTSPVEAPVPATLGFAIASQYLLLTGGDRAVTLAFQLTRESQDTLDAALFEMAAATGLEPDIVFEQVLDAAFDIYLSNSAGWFHLAAYSSKAILTSSPPTPPSFSLSFALPASAPPVSGFIPSDQPPAPPPVPDNLNPAPGVPSLKAYVRGEPVVIQGTRHAITVYPLSLLAPLEAAWIEIHTATSRLTNLEAVNTAGSVDTTSPFPVFGGTAVPGSFIQFGNPELFVKKPDNGSLRVSLRWFGLPANEDGFAGYYHDYLLGLDGGPSPTVLFDNQTFRGEIHIVNPGAWDLCDSPLSWNDSPPARGVFLFRTEDFCSYAIPSPDGTLCDETDFDDLEVIDADPPPYYDPQASAIRITLTEPSYAFGNSLYASNVLNAVIADLPQVDKSASLSAAVRPMFEAASCLDSAMQKAKENTRSADYRSSIQAAVKQCQDRLINAVQTYLLQAVSNLYPSAVTWVARLFSTPGSSNTVYRAQAIRTRLQTAVPSGKSAANFSPPTVPEGAAQPAANAAAMLQGVIWMQQCLDYCAGVQGENYQRCIETQLAACQQKLRGGSAAIVQTPSAMNYPNAPWYPQAKAIAVSYSATCGFQPSIAADARYFHLLPFGGYAPGTRRPGASGTPLLAMPEPGNLELGFSSLDAAQNLELLFQMTSGTAPAAPAVTWRYLDGDTWLTFTGTQVPSDTTNGLQNTGIIVLNMPAAGEQTGTSADPSYRWICATTDRPDQFPDAIGIYPHPAVATWVSNGGGSGGHLKQPLPPYTIDSSVQNLPGIKVINQPIESFGGRPAEDDRQFQLRTAERLRHKDRAILSWDYERLILDRFPTIWKAQALSAMNTQGDIAPGAVSIVVVAGSDSIQVADPTQPLATSEMLEDIRQYVVSLASPFTSIRVINPVYVRIKVFAEVLFEDAANDGQEAGADVNRLNEDLIRYLSPWYYDVERTLRRGDYASEDAISEFIQTRSYVAALIRIHLWHDPAPETLKWYFLTSAAEHSIYAAEPAA